MTLRAFWAKPTICEIELFKFAAKPGGWKIFPHPFKNNNPGACFFSRMEFDLTYKYIKVYLYTSKRASEFQNKKTREQHVYWINPDSVCMLPLE